MKRVLMIIALLAGSFVAQAQTPEDQYVYIYNLIQEGDTLAREQQPAAALGRYREAHTALQSFQRGYPEWNDRVVKFRLNYLQNQISTISAALPQQAAPAETRQPAPGAAPAPSVPAEDLTKKLSLLETQVRQLQSDNSILEAKLKEALSLRPAGSDPQELAKAQERIRTLSKENDLLKVGLDQLKASGKTGGQAAAQAEVALAEANRKLLAETQRANTLESQKKELQNKLNSLIPSDWNAANIEKTQQALDRAKQNSLEQTELAQRLKAERDALQTRVNALSADAEAAQALRAENELLKKQLADSKSNDRTTADASQAQALVASLQSEKEILRLEKIALESKVKQLLAAAGPGANLQPPTASEDSKRLRELERERDDLQKKLQAATTSPPIQTAAAPARTKELEEEVASLRLRLQVLEAAKIPYTPEELALFRKPDTKLADVSTAAPKKDLPPGTTLLAADARRYFASREFDKAEDSYQQMLQKDSANIVTLGNLATVQLEQGKLAEAESTLKRALAVDSRDAFSLSTLGVLKLRQKDFDAALDALSRAAEIEPKNAQIQNRLGLVLSEKGMRGPAETALRKAIQLQPGYGEAHHNLAVVYITQKPPLIELARWHYQKGLAGGQPKNTRLEQMLEAAATAAK